MLCELELLRILEGLSSWCSGGVVGRVYGSILVLENDLRFQDTLDPARGRGCLGGEGGGVDTECRLR